MAGRECSNCQRELSSRYYSSNQWRKGEGLSQCVNCIESRQQRVQCRVCDDWFSSDNSLLQHQKTHRLDGTARECSKCHHLLSSDDYSSNQWRKGEGLSQCVDCIESSQQPVQCRVCDEWFSSDNSLLQHQRTHPNMCQVCARDFDSAHSLYQHAKTHVPRTVSCPICGDKKFRNAANAVAHVESGFCSGCVGKDNARQQIYQFISQNAPSLLQLAIENGGNRYEAPENPYSCKYCLKQFKNLSSQMNHEADVHGSTQQMRQLGW